MESLFKRKRKQVRRGEKKKKKKNNENNEKPRTGRICMYTCGVGRHI